jgi:hypothetical protein
MSMDIRPTAAAPPEVRRVSYDEHARAVARDIQPDDPDRAGRTAALAVRLEPLQRIQVAFDQLVAHAAGRRRGEAWDYAGPSFAHYARDALAHAREHSDVLHCAAEAADTMINHMSDQLTALEDAMDPNNPDRPSLTPDGSPHPLEAGGYDPNADPQLPGHESDVATGKAGQTTRAQADAIAAGDLARREADEEDRKAMEERTRARAEKLKAKAPRGPAPEITTPNIILPSTAAPAPAKPPPPPPAATKPPEASSK